jgi:hypothetical protein
VAVVVDGDVVGGGVSPGLGEDESVLGGALHEAELGPFAAEFGVGDGLAGSPVGEVGDWDG